MNANEQDRIRIQCALGSPFERAFRPVDRSCTPSVCYSGIRLQHVMVRVHGSPHLCNILDETLGFNTHNDLHTLTRNNALSPHLIQDPAAHKFS